MRCLHMAGDNFRRDVQTHAPLACPAPVAMHKEEVEVTVQVESEYAPVGGVVRGTLTVNSRKILPFLRIVAAVRVRLDCASPSA